MKYLNYKNILIIVVIFFTLFIFINKGVLAETAEELRNKIAGQNLKIDQIEKEIADYKKQLVAIGKEANNLKNSLAEMDLTKKKLQADIRVTENKIEVKNLEINELGLEIENKGNNILKIQGSVSQGMKKINEIDSLSMVETLLSQNRISNFWQEVEGIVSLQSELRKKITEIKDVKITLEKDKKKTEEYKKELLSLKEDLGDQKKIVEETIKESNKLLKETKNKESNYNKIVKDKEKLKEAFEKETEEYEAQLKYILNPDNFPKAGSMVFNWPVNNVYITQVFGYTSSGKTLYANSLHKGVDFGVSVGTPVKTVASGVVVGVGDTDASCYRASFGKWVLIKHYNGLTTNYAHLSLIKVRAGETVASGQIIAYSGNSGYSTGPHLHLGVYPSDAVEIKGLPMKTCNGKIAVMPVAPLNAYLDALLYLPKPTKAQYKWSAF